MNIYKFEHVDKLMQSLVTLVTLTTQSLCVIHNRCERVFILSEKLNETHHVHMETQKKHP